MTKPKLNTVLDLEVFVEVARTGSMSEAARVLSLSPALISKRISQLEDGLRARLLQRTTRHITLTDTGQGFYARAIDILSLYNEANDFVGQDHTGPRGVLRVSAPAAFVRSHIAPHLPDFFGAFPEVVLDLHADDRLIDLVGDGYDLAIRMTAAGENTLIARKLAPVERVVCGAPAYFELAGRPEKPQDLAFHNCLTSGPRNEWTLDGPGGPHTIAVRGHVHANSGDVIHQLCVRGCGLTLAPLWQVGNSLEAGELEVALPEYTGNAEVAPYALSPSANELPAKAEVFLEFLRERFADASTAAPSRTRRAGADRDAGAAFRQRRGQAPS